MLSITASVTTSALPVLTAFSGASNVGMQPARPRLVTVALGTGGAASIVIAADGSMQMNTAPTGQTYLSLDGIRVRRT